MTTQLSPSYTQYKVLGPKGVLVKLQPYKGHTTTESGIVIPQFENYETDGGKISTKLKESTYSSIAEVLQISKKCEDLLKEDKMDVKVGDMIAIYPQANNPTNWFLLQRETPVADHEGYLLINHNLIQAKIDGI